MGVYCRNDACEYKDEYVTTPLSKGTTSSTQSSAAFQFLSIQLPIVAMVSKSLILAGLLSLAAASPARTGKVQSSPAKEPKPKTYPDVEARKKLHLGTAVSGALDLPTTVTHAPKPTRVAHGKAAFAANAGYMTVTVVNQNGGDITTVHVNGAGPTPVAGNTAPGILGNGQTDSFVLPPGWNGNVAINDAAFSATTGDESLIEGSFVDQGQGYAQGDLNISFV